MNCTAKHRKENNYNKSVKRKHFSLSNNTHKIAQNLTKISFLLESIKFQGKI